MQNQDVLLAAGTAVEINDHGVYEKLLVQMGTLCTATAEVE